MIGMNAPSLPPVELSDSAMRLASTLLQIAVDPNATSARLTELNTATQGLRDAITQHDAAKTQAETAAAGLADLQQREQNLAEAQAALATRETQLSVANHANAARAASLDDREAELAKHIAEHEAKLKANEDRIAQVRASLSA